MQIGIIGAGQVAVAFAKKAIDQGHSVVLSNSRGPDSLTNLIRELGPQAEAAEIREVVSNSVVLLAIPWSAISDVLQKAPSWNGQILIDTTNAFLDGGQSKGLVEFVGENSSGWVAKHAPGARIVKAINSSFMTNFTQSPLSGNLRRVAFLSGDDAEAKDVVADLLESFGFAPIDLGNLKEGGDIQSVGGPIAGHDFFVPWPAPRDFPGFNARQKRGMQ